MERVRTLEQPENTTELDRLLPEIAELMETSVSILESYPTEIRKLLCQTYVAEPDKNQVKQVFNNIITLDTSENIQKESFSNLSEQEQSSSVSKQVDKGVSKISIESFKRAARIIAERNQERIIEQRDITEVYRKTN